VDRNEVSILIIQKILGIAEINNLFRKIKTDIDGILHEILCFRQFFAPNIK